MSESQTKIGSNPYLPKGKKSLLKQQKKEARALANAEKRELKRPVQVSKDAFRNEVARLYSLAQEREIEREKIRVKLNKVENDELEIDCRKLKAYKDIDDVTVSEWFSAVVMLYMQKKGITQMMLSRVLGWNQSTLSRYLNGRYVWGLEDCEEVCRLVGLRFPEILIRKRK